MSLSIHVRCNKNLPVSETGGSLVLAESCPAGHGQGELAVKILDHCAGCPFSQDGRPEHAIAQPPRVEEAPAEKPADFTDEAEPEVHSPSIALPSEFLEAPLQAQLQLPPMPAFKTAPAAAAVDIVDRRDYQETKNELPELHEIILPSGLTLAGDTKGVPDVGAILETIPGCPHGQSTGGHSAHRLMQATCWRRAYLGQVLGWEKVARNYNLEFGTLFHAVLAMRYLHGAHRQWEPCEAVAHAGGADMAYNVKKLLTVQFEKYQQTEWETWCPRGVEENLVAWLPVKVGQKTLPIPLSCRVDLIIAFKRPSEPHPGPGPVPGGVSLLDWKTAGAITFDLLQGYGMDFQFLMQCSIFKLGRYDLVYGPLRGVMVSLAGKKRKEPIFDDFQRIESPISHGMIEDFIEYELKPRAAELHLRLTDPAYRADIHLWPRDRRLCIGRYGPCDFFDYCDHEAAVAYKATESRIITVDSLLQPPSGWKAEDGGAATASEAKKAKSRLHSTKAAADAPETAILATAILKQINTDPAFTGLRSDNFLNPGHNFAGVVRQLGQSLKAFYEPLAGGKAPFHLEAIEWRIQKSGCAWKRAGGDKGRVSWGAVAEWICRNDWFDLATAMPD